MLLVPAGIGPVPGQSNSGNLATGTDGQPLYIIPQQIGGSFILQAQLPAGFDFSNGFQWVTNSNVQAVPGNPSEVSISTDTVQIIQVQLLVASSGVVAATFNVAVAANPIAQVALETVNQIDDETGPTHQKIALNGTPMSDRKPQAKEQTDNKSDPPPYIDALNLGLHYTATDVDIPLPSGELSLSVRRSLHSETWNFRHGMPPGDRPDEAFGCSWSTNLVCGIEFINQQAIQSPINRQGNYAYVNDELGRQYRFLILKNNDANATTEFLPLPASISDQDAYLTTLTFDVPSSTYTFTKPHGTVLKFQPTTVSRSVLSDAYTTSVVEEIHTWARVTTVTDRVQETLTYPLQCGY